MSKKLCFEINNLAFSSNRMLYIVLCTQTEKAIHIVVNGLMYIISMKVYDASSAYSIILLLWMDGTILPFHRQKSR